PSPSGRGVGGEGDQVSQPGGLLNVLLARCDRIMGLIGVFFWPDVCCCRKNKVSNVCVLTPG
ncbi:hypothetical protein PN441_17880, partial [Spirulina major CS-329]|uniref:hypothetical protein n=2 Tax=Spirulina TaxID=1154 RepID=UPI002330AD0D